MIAMIHNLPGIAAVVVGVALSFPSLGCWALLAFAAGVTAALMFDRRVLDAVLRWIRRR